MRNGNDSGESGDQGSNESNASGKGRSEGRGDGRGEGRKNNTPLSPLAIDALCEKLFDPSVPLLGHESPADDAAAASMLRCPEVLGSFVVLQPAYVWYCPHCGQENFAKCEMVKFTEEQKEAIQEAYGACDEDQFPVSPDTVCCKNCGSQFDSLDENEWDANEEIEFAGGIDGGDDDDEGEGFGEETEWDRYKAGDEGRDDDGEGYFEIRDESPDEDGFQEFDPEGDFDDDDFDEDFDDDFAEPSESPHGQQILPIFAGEENCGEVMPPELDGQREDGDGDDGESDAGNSGGGKASNHEASLPPTGQKSRRTKSDDGRNTPIPPYAIGETHWWVDNPFGVGWNPPGV